MCRTVSQLTGKRGRQRPVYPPFLWEKDLENPLGVFNRKADPKNHRPKPALDRTWFSWNIRSVRRQVFHRLDPVEHQVHGDAVQALR